MNELEESAKIEAQSIFDSFFKNSSLCLTVSGARKIAKIVIDKIIAKERSKTKPIKEDGFSSLKNKEFIIAVNTEINFYTEVRTQLDKITSS